MNINSVLKKEGIEILKPLDCFTINLIAKSITDKLYFSFSNHIIDKNELFIAISRMNMYIAKMPNDSSCAKYFYKNHSIYFSNSLNIENMCELATHECIHFLQEIYDNYGNLNQLGLYKLREKGLAINEAAVQFMASIANGYKKENVKYYNISINTISPNYYPLECVLINQMTYFTGTYALYESTLQGTNLFKDMFVNHSNRFTYNLVLSNLDKLLQKEEELHYFNLELQYANLTAEITYLNKKILKLKETISQLFFETQNSILQQCFHKEFENIKTKEDLKIYQNRLYHYKDIIGYSENYNFYNEFYRYEMSEIERKNEEINQYDEEFVQPTITALTTISPSVLSRTFSKLVTLFRFNTSLKKHNLYNR